MEVPEHNPPKKSKGRERLSPKGGSLRSQGRVVG